jgi:hypothetical protein
MLIAKCIFIVIVGVILSAVVFVGLGIVVSTLLDREDGKDDDSSNVCI